ncbi:hypothetical protein EN12_21085 [Vibrio cholerae]|uniref:Uncharacterized protein n=1 Tax=Vibrio cholerae TaxID=666 RepID=A0A5B1C0Q9_VIBCL|nr:hypothetical protein [Vibrio cholerae]AKO77622.1 hypothetical protein EN12_21085 [Vibrio cholerae]KAA1253662.1 hypothetical protein F0M16_16430 [Vibrio cholerae]HDV5593927.1 hypothetical protein [Vibrio cholerae]
MKELLKSIFTKDNAKSFIHRFNDNLDKVIAFRDSIGKKSLVGFLVVAASIALNHYDILGGLAILVSVIAGIYTFFTFGVYMAFHILEFYVTSKINAAVGSVVRVGIVADELTDYTVEKFREQRTQNNEKSEA